MTRILHVIATLDRGGTEVSCLTLARAFSNLGIENHVVAISRGNGGIESEFAEVSSGLRVLPGKRVAGMISFRQHIREIRPDAVIFHFFHIEHVLLAAVARFVGITKIVTKQGNPAPTNPKVLRKVRLILSLTRVLNIRLVCSSEWIEKSFKAVGRLPRHSAVVHNGCNVDDIANRAAVSRIGKSDKTIVFGMIARLDPIKDHITLIDAFAMLRDKIDVHNVVLKLIGDGVLEQKLKQRVIEKGLEGSVIFAGARSDIPAELGQMDTFILSTTRDEGFGVVLIESLAAGVPVVASDVPATREVLAGGLGKLFKAGDARSLAKLMTASIKDPPTVPNRTSVKKRFGSNIMAKKYLDIMQLNIK